MPYLPRLQPAAVSGCVTYAPSHIREVLNALALPVAADNANVVAAKAIDDLPNVEWEEVQIPIREGEAVVQRPGFRARPESVAQPAKPMEKLSKGYVLILRLAHK